MAKVKINEVRKLAKEHSIKGVVGKKKADIIREIQLAEGNFDCFGSAGYECDQLDCLWREDCLLPMPKEK